MEKESSFYNLSVGATIGFIIGAILGLKNPEIGLGRGLGLGLALGASFNWLLLFLKNQLNKIRK